MTGAALETGETGEWVHRIGDVTFDDELRRSAALNAWHEREGSQRKVKLGRQIFQIREERRYARWDHKDLNAYTKAELNFGKEQAEQYVKVRGLSLELLEGSDIALTKLVAITAQDERLHEGLVQAARERRGVKIGDLKRGGEAGLQVLEGAAEDDEAAHKEARRRAYEEALRKEEAAEGPEGEAAADLRRGVKQSQDLKKLFQKRLDRQGKEDAASTEGAFLLKLDESLRDLILLRVQLHDEPSQTLLDCLTALRKEEPAGDEETVEAEESAEAEEEAEEVEAEEVEAEDGDETSAAETFDEEEDAEAEDEETLDEEESAEAEDEETLDEEESAEAEDEETLDEAPDAPPDNGGGADERENAWLLRAVQGTLGVLAEQEKQKLSDLLYAGLRGADVAPLLGFMDGVLRRAPAWARADLSMWIEAAGHKDLWERWIYLFSFFVEARLPDMRKRLFCLRALQLPPEYEEMVQEVYPGNWGPYEDMPAPIVPRGTSERDRHAIEGRWYLEVARRMAAEMKPEGEVSDLAQGSVMGEAFDLDREFTLLERWLKDNGLL